MDGFIVVIGIVGKALSGANIEWWCLRTMRVLRPLRVISRVPELKVVVNALLNSAARAGERADGVDPVLDHLRDPRHAAVHGRLLAVQRTRASRRRRLCGRWVNQTRERDLGLGRKDVRQPTLANATSVSLATCVGSYQSVEYVERTWASDDMNFDNIFNAMQTLFEMSTTEGWTAVMYNGVDARSPELAPQRDYQPAMAFFFVAFEVIANFFILNLFVGIILDNFAQLSSESGDDGSSPP